jgi:hypothetical protein
VKWHDLAGLKTDKHCRTCLSDMQLLRQKILLGKFRFLKKMNGLHRITPVLGSLALWNKGLAAALPHGTLLLTNHSSYASEPTIPRGKLKDHFV